MHSTHTHGLIVARAKPPIGWPRISLLFLAVLLTTAGLSGQVRMTREEALALYFPGATIERSTAFLTDGQVDAIQQRARASVESKIVTYYTASEENTPVGTAFLETKTVRTMPATFIVVINPDTTVRSVELLAFHEPEDYMPSRRWLDQFNEAGLRDDLFLKRGVQNIAGATLSARAISDAVRRLLATYAIVVAPGSLR